MKSRMVKRRRGIDSQKSKYSFKQYRKKTKKTHAMEANNNQKYI